MTISELINCIRDTHSGPDAASAIQRLRKNPAYYLNLRASEGWPKLGRRIFKDMVAGAEPLLKRDLHDIEREAYGTQAAMIAQAICSLNEEQRHTKAEAPAAPNGKPKPKTRLTLDKARQRIGIDGTWHDLTDSELSVFRVLLNADGAWVQGKTFEIANANKTIERMKKPVKTLINSGRHGYRIKPEYTSTNVRVMST